VTDGISRLTEEKVTQAFSDYLENDGWSVATDLEGFIDLQASRNGEVLVAEVKGHTKSPGTAIDIGFGQLLRRMTHPFHRTRYALVVPASLQWHVNRVVPEVRSKLSVEIYIVSESGKVSRI